MRLRRIERAFVLAVVVVGLAIGVVAAVAAAFHRSSALGELVVADVVAAFALVLALLSRQRRKMWWDRSVGEIDHPSTGTQLGYLRIQAEAVRHVVGADGAAIVVTITGQGPRTAAISGTVSRGMVPGSPAPTSVVLAELRRPGRPRPWDAALPTEDPLHVEGMAVAACGLPTVGDSRAQLIVWSTRTPPRALRQLRAVSRVAGDAIERAWVDEAEQRSRLGASHARRHLALLVAASAALGQALDDWQPALEALVDEIVPLHADYFAVDLVDSDGALRRLVGAHIDPKYAQASVDPHGLEPEWEAEFSRAARGAKTIVCPTPRATAGDSPSPVDPVLHALHAHMELDSWTVVPIRLRGLSLGALSAGTVHPRRGLRPSDIGTYEELAGRCAAAFERVTLYRETQAAARAAEANVRRLTHAVEAAPGLAASLNVEAILQGATGHALRTLDAVMSAVSLRRLGAGETIMRTTGDAPSELVAELLTTARAACAAGAAARGTRPVPWLAAPLIAPGGRSIGVLVVSGAADRAFAAEEESVLILLAQMTGTVIAQAEVYETAAATAQRLETLVESSPLAILEVAPSGELRSWNGAAVELFQWSLAVATPTLAPTTSEAFATLRERLARGAAVVADRSEIVRHSDGAAVRVSVAAALVPRTDGDAEDLLCMLTNITQQELLEHALQTRQRMEAIGRLAGGVAHDFNNLLTVIIGYSDLLANRLGPDHPYYDDVDAIRGAGRRAAAFTEQLLTISGHRVAETATVDLAATVGAIEPVLERLVGGDVTLRVTLAPDTGWIKIDHGQFEQVILNLVVNARDAMPDGGTLGIATVSTTDPDGTRWSLLIVEDSGIGMDEATVERCFEPFFTTKDRGKGTGLGLATVYRVVDEAGGDVSVDSAPGMGTRITVTLPAATAEEVASALPAPPRGEEVVDRNAVILLVEDDAEVRAFARTVLADAGYSVHDAAHGAAALEITHRLDAPVALLVTDVVMPGLSGLELTMRMPGVPVLFISGFIEDERRQDLLQETPSSRFLAKPFLARQLLDEVRELLSGMRQGSNR